MVISDEVTSIGEFAFYGCESLTSVTIPKNCDIEDDTFPDTYLITRR